MNNFEENFSFLQGEEEIKYSQKLSSYMAPSIIAIMLSFMVVLCADMLFLGIGLINSIYKEFKTISLVLIIVKVFIDLLVFTLWFLFAKEKADRAKFSTLLFTETRIIIISNFQQVKSFEEYNLKDVTLSVKRDLLHKFCGLTCLKVNTENGCKKFYVITEKDNRRLEKFVESKE